MIGAKPHSVETHLFISGKVQGVFFRAKTKAHADRLNLNGYVENLSDGRVEICIEGKGVEPLITLLKKEPLPISIEHIEAETRTLESPYSSFTILH